MRFTQRGLRASLLGATLAWVGCILLLAPVVIAQDTESVTFTLVNGTDYVIMEFYASPPSSDDWEEDILGVDVLEPDEAVDITIDDWREDCNYDFLAVFEDGTELEHVDVSVCDDEEYVYE